MAERCETWSEHVFTGRRIVASQAARGNASVTFETRCERCGRVVREVERRPLSDGVRLGYVRPLRDDN